MLLMTGIFLVQDVVTRASWTKWGFVLFLPGGSAVTSETCYCWAEIARYSGLKFLDSFKPAVIVDKVQDFPSFFFFSLSW